jgi:hypothetical protein
MPEPEDQIRPAPGNIARRSDEQSEMPWIEDDDLASNVMLRHWLRAVLSGGLAGLLMGGLAGEACCWLSGLDDRQEGRISDSWKVAAGSDDSQCEH